METTDVRQQPTTIENYQLQAQATSATAKGSDEEMEHRLRVSAGHLIHALQMVKQAGDIMDIVKRYVFYNDQSRFNMLVSHPGGLMPGEGMKDELAALIRHLHGTAGIATEAGEMAECILNTVLDGEPFDGVNFAEENGDTLWYIAENANAEGMGMLELMVGNIAKLRSRFPDAFNEQDAVNRDTDAERASLTTASTESEID